MAIGRHHDGALLGVQRIEGVQEFLLRRLLLGQEIQVVHQKRVAIAELLAEGAELVLVHRLDEAIGELLRSQEEDAPVGKLAAQGGVDAFHEMRLAGADGAVKDERDRRIVGGFDEVEGGGMSDAVTWPDDEFVELAPAPLPGRALGVRGVGARRFRRGGFALPGRLKQLRIDHIAQRRSRAEHFLRGRLHVGAEFLLQPILQEEIRHADGDDIVIADELRLAGEPEVKTRFPNPLA